MDWISVYTTETVNIEKFYAIYLYDTYLLHISIYRCSTKNNYPTVAQ